MEEQEGPSASSIRARTAEPDAAWIGSFDLGVEGEQETWPKQHAALGAADSCPGPPRSDRRYSSNPVHVCGSVAWETWDATQLCNLANLHRRNRNC